MTYSLHIVHRHRCTLWGEDPCSLMKLIISNHSSSMKKKNDGNADTSVCWLRSTGVDNITCWMQNIRNHIWEILVMLFILCRKHVHCTYKHVVSVIYKCIFGMSTDETGNHRDWVRCCDTYSAVHVSFSPYCVMLVVNDLWAAHDMKISHHVLLDVS